MTDIDIAWSPESVIESVRFTRKPDTCKWGGHHDCYRIHWTGPDGPGSECTYWCDHPLCSASDTGWRISTTPPQPRLTLWLPRDTWPALSTAYFLLVYGGETGWEYPHMEARIGVCSQWLDRAAGNYEVPDHPELRPLFTERYFAHTGPGVYPAPIEDI